MPNGIAQQAFKLTEYGVAGIVLAVVLVCVIALVWWMLRQFEKTQLRLEKSQERLDKAHEDMANERAKWFEVTTALKTSIEAHTFQAIEYHKRSLEEHEKMCSALTETMITLKSKPCLIER